MRLRLPVLFVILVVSVSLFGLAGCGSSSGQAHALDGSAWRLRAWKVSSLDPNDFTITARFVDGKISGDSGVNTYGGPYAAGPGTAFSVGDLAVTTMGGLGPEMQAENAYLTALGEAKSFKRSGDRLTLFDQHGNESLIFRAAGP